MQHKPQSEQHSTTTKPSVLGVLSRLRERSDNLPAILKYEWRLSLGLLVSLFLFLTLFSYHPGDAGFFSSGSGDEKIYNWGDATGAWLASFLLFVFGVFAYVLPFGVALVSWVVFRIRLQGSDVNRRQLLISSASLFLLISTGSVLASLYLDSSQWFVSLPYSGGGVWGYWLSQLFIAAIDRLATTLLMLLLFAQAFSWIIGISLLQIIDLTGEGLWLVWHWLKDNWRHHWKPSLLKTMDNLVEAYQAWRRGEAVIDADFSWKTWFASLFNRDVRGTGTRLFAKRTAITRPVGEYYARTQAADIVPDVAISIPGLLSATQACQNTANTKPTPLAPAVEASVVERTTSSVTPTVQSTSTPAPATKTQDNQITETQPTNWQEKLRKIEKEGYVAVDRVKATLPSLSLLDPVIETKPSIDAVTLEHMGNLLERTLKEYKIDATVESIISGPVVTLFELQPAPGVKVGAIVNLSKDLARSMSVLAVRVVDIIPGKTVIGIEIPNPSTQVIHFKEVISTKEYQDTEMILPIVMGQDTTGLPVVADLAKMPHVLVAGQTGSGKSVGVNAMIMSLVYHATADEVKFIMIDPKMIELAVYADIPHLLSPVVTDMNEAANALRWSVVEMERRYQLMSKLGVRNIAGYNEKVKAAIEAGQPLVDPLAPSESFSTFDMAPPPKTLEPLPYIVVIVDEFADLFMVVGKKVEELIARLAQKARAAGIHIVLATQRPSVDVVTGLIKANIPARIAFKVASKIDSRTILDQMGADQLLGRGDMLYLGNGMGHPQRVHGPYVSDDEVHRVVDFLKTQGAPDYVELNPDAGFSGDTMSPTLTGLFDDEPGGAEKDVFYDEAVAFVMESGKVSISSIQRRFRIGYNRSARIVEAMEEAGLVSAPSTNGNREILAGGRA